MKHKRHKYSLRSQISISFVLIAIFIVNSIGWFLYYRTEQFFDKELGKKLLGIATFSADIMDSELLNYLRPGDESGKFYHTLQNTLNILKNDFNVNRIYIINDSLQVLVDTEIESTIGGDIHYLQINRVELRNTLEGIASISTIYRGEDGNLYKSAFAPIRDRKNRIIAISGVDASPRFLEVIDDIKSSIILINLISLSIALIMSFILARVVVNPVKKLVRAAKRISDGDLSKPISISSENEIGYLGKVFNTMQNNIKNNEQILQRLRQTAEDKADTIKTYNDYILQSISNGILTIDLNGKITVLNKEAKKLLRIYTNRNIGKNILSVIEKNHPIRSIFEEKISSSPKYDFFEMTLYYNNISISISVQVSPLVDSMQKIIGINFVITDLTELLTLQEKIKEQEQMAYLGQLSATIAHEIRNPLNSMALFMGLLKREANIQSDQQDIINRVEQEIKSLNEIVTDFLLFARPSELEYSNFLISNLIKETSFLAENNLRGKEILVKTNFNDVELNIEGDFDQLKQAFLNIFLNAIDSMEMGGTLTIEVQQVPEKWGEVEICVTDTGTGLDPQFIQEIFKPFYSTRSQGTGLGLTIVKNIIEAHHGDISVKSKIGYGTTFYIHLPKERI